MSVVDAGRRVDLGKQLCSLRKDVCKPERMSPQSDKQLGCS